MKTVLIADDNDVLITSLKVGLKKYEKQFKAIFVENGLEAMNILETRPVDLVVTDIQMPMIDGLVLLAFMRENFSKTPCIIMSAHGSPDLKNEIQNDILTFIDKPINVDSLARQILKAFSGQSAANPASRIAILDILKMIMIGKKTCIFKLKASDGTNGFFYFQEGEIFNAIWGRLHGEEAITAMLNCDDAELSFTRAPEKKGEQKITKSFSELIRAAKSSNLKVSSSQIIFKKKK